MTTPQAGITHDVVIHVNTATFCGLVIKDFTYRANIAPSFVPRFAIGDVKGIDRARWRSWMQSRFDGGAGQYYWGSSASTNKFAESSQIDIGYPFTTRFEQRGAGPQVTVNVDTYEDIDYAAIGDVSPAVIPRATSGISNNMVSLWRDDGMKNLTKRMWVIEQSNAPHAWVTKGLMVYTSIAEPLAWSNPSLAGMYDKLTGVWKVVATWPGNDDQPIITHAVKFSSVMVVAITGSGNPQMVVYGATGTAGANPSTFYNPQYSTGAYKLAVYDDKLWRTWLGNAAYLNPVQKAATSMGIEHSLIPAVWSDYLPIGDVGTKIVNTCTYNGKLYFGKEDGLWVYDAGVIYQVSAFHDERDVQNFSMMFEHRGYLYFNIRAQVLRLSSTGLIERIQTPVTKGAILSGAGLGSEVYWLHAHGDTGEQVACWVHNPDFGGTRQWWSHSEIAGPTRYKPTSIAAAAGMLWISPMSNTTGYTSLSHLCPIVAADRVTPPMYSGGVEFPFREPYMITSQNDFGLPNLEKLLNAVVVDYQLYSMEDAVDVYYLIGEELGERNALKYMYSVGPGYASDYTLSTVTNSLSQPGDSIAVSLGNRTGILLGFLRPPTGFKWFMHQADGGTPPIGLYDYFPEAASGPEALGGGYGAGVPFYQKRRSWHKVYNEDTGAIIDERRYYGPDWAYTEYQTPGVREIVKNQFKKGAINWISHTPQEIVAAYGNGFDIDDVSKGLRYFWLAISAGADRTTNARHVEAADDNPGIFLATAQWHLLGSIEGAADYAYSKKILSFPDNTSAKSIFLKFVFRCGPVSRPELRRYEIEWMPWPSNLEVHNFNVVAADGMEILNMTVENSAMWVQKTLWSLAASGSSYVCEVPWPEVHTIRAVVSLLDPGAFPPVLYYGKGNISTEIPIRLDEV